MVIMVMKGEMCAGDALIGYGKDLRGIGLCCCGKGQARTGVHRSRLVWQRNGCEKYRGGMEEKCKGQVPKSRGNVWQVDKRDSEGRRSKSNGVIGEDRDFPSSVVQAA